MPIWKQEHLTKSGSNFKRVISRSIIIHPQFLAIEREQNNKSWLHYEGNTPWGHHRGWMRRPGAPSDGANTPGRPGASRCPDAPFLTLALDITSFTLPASQGLEWEICEKCVQSVFKILYKCWLPLVLLLPKPVLLELRYRPRQDGGIVLQET